MPNETVLLEGHIINNLSLNRTLDMILDSGGDFNMEDIHLGQRNEDPSQAVIKVTAPTQGILDSILASIGKLGAIPLERHDVKWKSAPKEGVFPDDFYSTTNLETQIWFRNKWIPVKGIEMDCGIIFDPDKLQARCVPLIHIKKGDKVITGREGSKVIPLKTSGQKEIFSFMGSSVSSEKPKHLLIRDIAGRLAAIKKNKGKILFVGGPAVIHTGAGKSVASLIKKGYINALLAGNGFATHDIESALYGTSLGISLEKGTAVHGGHRNHLRAINTIRAAGSIKAAVNKGILKSGILYTCVKTHTPYVLAGSIRDDGPLPDVIRDSMEAQEQIRYYAQRVDAALMVGSTLHAIATGNCLPARVYTVCVDINPAVVTKLGDRGTAQSMGIVTDAASFLGELALAL